MLVIRELSATILMNHSIFYTFKYFIGLANYLNYLFSTYTAQMFCMIKVEAKGHAMKFIEPTWYPQLTTAKYVKPIILWYPIHSQ